MKLLFDQNLPRSLARHAEGDFPNSAHVRDLSLETATDAEIFEFALKNEFTIISKDNDFANMSFLRGAPPKVIWIRAGNCTASELKAILERHIQRLHRFESEPESFLILHKDVN